MKYLLTNVLFFPVFLFAQTTIQGVIVNINKEPLPLSNVVSLNRNIGSITNENGEFVISDKFKTDSIKVSNVAYHSMVVALKDIKNGDTIFLTKNIRQLDEAVVKNLTSYKQETELGYFNYTANGEFKLLPGSQLALYIANKQGKEAWIKGVFFKVKELGKCKNSIRIRLLQLDTLRLTPSTDILDENVLIKSKDLNKSNYIDLSSHKISLPKEGVFIVLEWVYPDHNCDKNSYTSISSTLMVPTNIVWFNFRDKAWGKGNRPRLPNGNYMTPNVGLKVAY